MVGQKIGCVLLALLPLISAGCQPSLKAQSTDTLITLERTTCEGTCPSYKLTILGDGTVNFEGRKYVRVKGTVRSKIDPASVESLVQEFIKIDYFGLNDKYTTIKNPDGTETIVLDLPTTITSLTLAGKQKRIVDYVGAPQQLMELEDEIDKVANSKRWVSIDAETVHEKCQHGWDVNGKEAKGLLVHAARAGDTEVVRAFIKEGADIKSPINSISLLQIARGKEVLQALISAGGDVNAPAVGYVGPPLVEAAEFCDPSSIAVLIEAGAKVDGKSSDGTTALMMAAKSGVPECVELLLTAGADATNRDKFGETALDYARRGEERNADEEGHPGPYSGPMPDFRAKFAEVKRLLSLHNNGTSPG